MTVLRATLALLLLLALPARAEVQVQTVTSPGGLTAWLVEEPSIPFVALELRFRGGTSLDAPGRRGAVNLMAALIEEGAGDLDAQAFAEARDALAADFRFGASRDAVSVSARFLTENRDRAVDLLRQALIAPRFDDAAIARVRGQVLAGIRSDARDPDALASRRMAAIAYGDHPYGTPGDGTEESVAALTRDDILAAHRGALARDRLYVAAAGDISPADLGLLLDRLLSDLPAIGAPLPGPVAPALTAGVTVVDFPTPQAVVAFAQPGLPLDDPDYFAAYLLAEVMGGAGFGSRLMTELRERRGLTYGANVWLANYDLSAELAGRFATGNATAARAVDLLRAEWAKMAGQGITADELERSRTYLTGAYPLRFDGNAQIARILVGMQMDGRTPDYIATRNDRVNAVTLDQANRVAARLFRPEALRIVVVGQPEGVAPTD